MCLDAGIISGPVMMGIMAATTLASTAVTAIGQYQSGKQQENMAEYNAKMAKVQAVDAERRGAMAEAQQRQRANLIVGAMRANEGSSGVLGDTDSSLDVLAEAAEFGGRDAATARINAGREAYGFRARSNLDRYEAQSASANIWPRIGGTLLTGASQVFQQQAWWQQYQQKNPNPGYGTATPNYYP